jgi:hypothetical protein
MAAVVTALSFIPFSIGLGIGTSFPLAQAVYPLCGILLGPIAGAIAAGIGAGIGVFVAPHTAGMIPLETVIGVMIGAFFAGTFVKGPERGWWWAPPALLTLLNFIVGAFVAILVAGVDVGIYILSTLTLTVSYLLILLPTRKLWGKWVRGKNLLFVFLGVALVTLNTTTVIGNAGIGYYIYMWPNEVWGMLIPIMPVENLFRMIVAGVIGTGVIAGIRAIGLVKPKWAVY